MRYRNAQKTISNEEDTTIDRVHRADAGGWRYIGGVYGRWCEGLVPHSQQAILQSARLSFWSGMDVAVCAYGCVVVFYIGVATNAATQAGNNAICYAAYS